MRRLRLLFSPALVLGLLAGGSIAWANSSGPHEGEQSITIISEPPAQVQAAVDQVTEPAPAPSPTPNDDEDCTKTTSTTISNSSPNSTNEVHTTVKCESDSKNGSTSVNISNDVHQSAHSGNVSNDGDGEMNSGSTSNTSNTDIDVDLH